MSSSLSVDSGDEWLSLWLPLVDQVTTVVKEGVDVEAM